VHRRVFQQLSNYSQAQLTRQNELVGFRKVFALSKTSIISTKKCGEVPQFKDTKNAEK